MGRRTVNAARDLAPDLYEALSEALGRKARMVWVPTPSSASRSKRDAYVLQLHEQGYTSASIGVRVCLSDRTIRRILAKARARRLPSDPAAGQGRQRLAQRNGGRHE